MRGTSQPLLVYTDVSVVALVISGSADCAADITGRIDGALRGCSGMSLISSGGGV